MTGLRYLGFRGLVAAFALLLGLALLAGGSPARAVSSDIVISQVYGGGGNAGATLTHDFIELFNRGTSAVSLSGWSVQYASASGSTWSVTQLSGSLNPGQYYLVQEAQGSGGTTALPTPDASGTIAMSASAGKVALVTSTTALTGVCGATCHAHASVRDYVGYGTATDYEGPAAAPALGNTTAAARAAAGCTDTDQNSLDFVSAAPAPRNTASPTQACAAGDSAPSVASTSPSDGGTNVPADAAIVVSFSEPVATSGTWFTIVCDVSGAHGATASVGPQTFTIDPDGFTPSDECTVTIIGAQVADLDSDDPPDTMAADYVLTFTVASDAATRIHDIQGEAHRSPLFGTTATNVPGVVTAVASNGFYLQDPDPDANDATSEGIFVFTSSSPSVVAGDEVRVTGQVAEFRPGGSSSTNLTTTELTGPTIFVVSSGSALPPATVIGAGGRVPPGTVIDDDATGDVETSGTFEPATDGIDFYESLEGMRIQVNNAVAVGPRNSFGEIPVVADDGADATVRTTRGGIVISASDFNPERIIVDDVLASTPAVNVGDHFTSPVVGVLDYSFGNFKLLATPALTRVDEGLAQESTETPSGEQIAVGTLNVENLDPGDGAAKLDALASLVVHNLKAPDILALEEVQDNTGPTNDGVVDATVTFNTLIAAIVAAGGPTYEFRSIDPVDGEDGGQPGGNIRVGFMFRTDRGVAFVDRSGGGPTTATSVDDVGGVPQLSASPGRIDPTNVAFSDSRKPLAAEFTFDGRTLFVVANHFNSKGGDNPLFGHLQPPSFPSEVQRHQQAQIVNDFVDQIVAIDPAAYVVVLGDLNDFDFSQTISILKGGVLHELADDLPLAERYSYVFDGNSQMLDHILVSNALLADGSPQYDIVHVNSEFAEQVSDHEPQVVRLAFEETDTTAPSISCRARPGLLWPPNGKMQEIEVRVLATDDSGVVSYVLQSVTSNERGIAHDAAGWMVGTPDTRGRLRAERDGGGDGRVYTLTYLATDGAGNTATCEAQVRVPHDRGGGH
ncbi:MAG: lamin tail domain-containing protein [Dehalococcoidia bacterium]